MLDNCFVLIIVFWSCIFLFLVFFLFCLMFCKLVSILKFCLVFIIKCIVLFCKFVSFVKFDLFGFLCKLLISLFFFLEIVFKILKYCFEKVVINDNKRCFGEFIFLIWLSVFFIRLIFLWLVNINKLFFFKNRVIGIIFGIWWILLMWFCVFRSW